MLTRQFGETVINAQAGKLYNKKVNGKAVEKGVAFPVCVSVNDVICNHSPLASEEVVSARATSLGVDAAFSHASPIFCEYILVGSAQGGRYCQA